MINEPDDDYDDYNDCNYDDDDLALKRHSALVTQSSHQLLQEHRRLVALRHLQGAG